jgi:hypothetical protein
MPTKQEILDEIKRTAKENGGKPLGVARFENETGIKPHDWEKHWPRFGDANREAGFEPNQFQGAHADEFLIRKLIGLIQNLSKYPTYRDIQVGRGSDPELPDKTIFQRLGSKQTIAFKVLEYCKAKGGYDDVIEKCSAVLMESGAKEADETNADTVGEVYLAKSGRYYKIGKTNDTVRRGSELRIQLPEKIELVHAIKTDDPSGIEAYWHERFKTTRKGGEWFDLTSRDVKAFKRWRRIY